MPANLENSAVATGLEKVSLHSNPKEKQCQRIFKVKVKSLSHVWLFATPWTVAYQASPSMGFSRQEYWSGLPFPSPGDLLNPRIKPGSPALEADALNSEPPRKLQECSNYRTIVLISHASKVMLKILQARLQQYITMNFQMFKLDLEKAEEPEVKLPTSAGSLKKQESSRKTPTSALLTTPKPLTVWVTIKCGKFLKRWEYRTTWPASWETCMQVRKQQLELDMEQQTGSKSGKEYVKAVYCHPAY